MPKQPSKGIDKEAMFKKIMPSASKAISSEPFDDSPDDSFHPDAEGFAAPRPRRAARPAAQTARTRPTPDDDLGLNDGFGGLDMLDHLGDSLDPLDSFDLFDQPPARAAAPKQPHPAKNPPKAKAKPTAQQPIPIAQPPQSAKTRPVAQRQPPDASQQTAGGRQTRPAPPARQKRAAPPARQNALFPIDTTVLQNPAAPNAPVPPPLSAAPPAGIPRAPAAILPAPAAPTAPVPVPPSRLQQQPFAPPARASQEDYDPQEDVRSAEGYASIEDYESTEDYGSIEDYRSTQDYESDAQGDGDFFEPETDALAQPCSPQQPYPRQQADYPRQGAPEYQPPYYPAQPCPQPSFFPPDPAGMPVFYPPQQTMPAPAPSMPVPAEPQEAMPSAEELVPVNVSELLLARQLDGILERLGGCKCEKCRLEASAHALNGLPVHYILAGQLREELLFDRKAVAQTASALCRAVLFVKSHPHH